MKYNFSISSRILSHLGEDLIKNESIALLELVKNSYDACASFCNIYFDFDSNSVLQSIVIKDDGHGMDREVIENVWLTIGTDFKKKKLTINSCDRIPLGEKGIGRLGVHKLGNKITLISRKKRAKEIEVHIDWSDLDNIETIDEFYIRLIEYSKPKHFTKNVGTKIIIDSLKGLWDIRSLKEVYRTLTALHSPFSNKSDSFEVQIESNNDIFRKLPDFQDIKNAALYFGHCKMEGSVITEFSYEFKPWDTLIKLDNGRRKTLKDLQSYEKNLVDERHSEIDLNKKRIGPIEFNLIIFEMDSQIFSFMNSERQSIRDYLRENGGIRVYRDDLRIYDYGEKANDWLGIDLKRVHRVGGNVSNNILIGSVQIERGKSFDLKEKSNREGFVEDETFQLFTSAINYTLSLFVKERNIDKELLTQLYKKHKEIEPVLSDLNDLILYVKNHIENVEIKEEVLMYLLRINDQYKNVKEILIKSANAGLNLSVVIHEIDKLISALSNAIQTGDKSRLTTISSMLEKIIKGYSAMIKKSQIRLSYLKKPIQIALDNYEFRFLDHKIDIVLHYSHKNLQAYFAEAETISVITNLLDNSIYWLSYARQKERAISLFITDQIKGYNSIIISDNGPGFNIPKEMAVRPFITGKPHNIGSGLGLHIASEMMAAMKGRLLFLEEDDVIWPEALHQKKVLNSIITLAFPKTKP